MKNILIITNQSVTIKKESERLLSCYNSTCEEIRIREIEAILCFGNIQITSQALELIAEQGIPLSVFSFGGEIKYQVLNPTFTNLDLRFHQYENYINQQRRIQLAKYFVVEKIKNAYEFFKNSKSRKKPVFPQELKNEFKLFIIKALNCKSLDKLLGIEGIFTRTYFNYLSQLSNGEIKFLKRSKHPPKDEANSLLSFIYTLTLSIISSMAFATGFDLYTGFLHSEKYGRKSFALDVLEIFRPNFCDRFFIELTNKKIISKKHFEHKENSFYLNSEGRRRFFTHWKERVYNEDGGENNLIYNVKKRLEEIARILRSGEDINFDRDYYNL